LAAVARRQFLESELAHAQRAALCAEVAEDLLRRARVGGDDADDRLVLLVLGPHLRGRDAQPFLVVVEDALDGLAAWSRATDVGVMENVHREADQRAVVERGLRDEEIGKMSGAEERIVEQDRVAGRKG